MKKKLDIGLGLSDAFQHLVKNKDRFMINYLFALGVGLFSAALTYFTVVDNFTYMSYNGNLSMQGSVLGDMLKTIPIFVVITLVNICIQGVYTKITDDAIEKRELTYGEQFSFVFKRLGKVILASLIAVIPLIGIYMLIFATMSFMFLSILAMVYILMLTFINQSIIIDDVSAFQSIINSFAVVSHNFFRLMFTFLGIGIFILILSNVIQNTSIIFEVMSVVINMFISLYMVVFLTALYKQTTLIKRKEVEIEYFENYE